MPKLKNKSGATKRFKVTATGLVMCQPSRKRHNLRKRTPKMKRQARGTTVLHEADGKRVLRNYLRV